MIRESRFLLSSPDESLLSPKDAISAFIKSVRLRYLDDALLWMAYLWQFPKERQRIKLRILLESGEDNLSVDVIEQVGEWYGSAYRNSLEAAAAEVVRICATENWWAQHDGRQYIYAWYRAEMEPQSFKMYELDELFEVMRMAIVEKTMTRGLSAFNAVYRRRDFQPSDLAKLLRQWSELYGGQQAERLSCVFERHVSSFWLDGNVSGQTYYALINGDFGEHVCPEVERGQVESALVRTSQRLKDGISIPSYARDGVHTKGGSDRRFAGIVKFMSGSCRAYEHYGRLSPVDEWLPSFMALPRESS